MRLVEIRNRSITLDLDPEDAVALAGACRAAVTADAAPDYSWCETVAALFDAAAIAAAAVSYAHGLDLDDYALSAVRRQLAPRETRYRPAPEGDRRRGV